MSRRSRVQIPADTPFFLGLAQLVERWTVIVFFVVIHRSLVQIRQSRLSILLLCIVVMYCVLCV